MSTNSQPPDVGTFRGFPPTYTTRCPECRYDLRGLPATHRCPECGLQYDDNTLVIVQLAPPNKKATREIRANLLTAAVLFYVGTMIPRPWHLAMIAMGLGLLVIAWQTWKKYRQPPRNLAAIGPDGILIRDEQFGARLRSYAQIKIVRIGNILGNKTLEVMLDRDQVPDKSWADSIVLPTDQSDNVDDAEIAQRARDYQNRYREESKRSDESV